MVCVATLLVFMVLHAAFILTNAHEEQVWSVMCVSGRSCDLPCYLRPRTSGDKAKLILWYKKGNRAPVLSYDGRMPQLLEDIRAENTELKMTRETATLTFTHLALQHAGLYECRVEFFRSPTHTSLVNLTLVEPPRVVEVRDRQKGPPKNGVLGPYEEGVMVVFTCLARDGWPLPNVTWWRGSKMVDGGWEVSGPRLVRNDLVVSKLTRDWHNDTLICTASNTKLVPPFSVSATIQMYLLPTNVAITGPTTAREGHRMRLRCTSRGSRPSARLAWTLQGKAVPAEKENTVYGRVTSSTLVVNVSREQDGSTVTCRAANPAVPTSPLSNSTTLTVLYPPQVNATLGRSLKPRLLKEGDDVYFTCSVAANPPATSITWYHEGKQQVQNVSAGIIISKDSLVVQKVQRGRAGRYHCRAINPLASVTSNPVKLKIRYLPECDTAFATYFIYDRPINVTCTVSAFPPASAILWRWNSSSDVIKAAPEIIQQEKTTAMLTVHLQQRQEDRALSCWAVNEMGRQLKPCTFSVKVAKTPLPLSSCRLANITASSLSLTCQRPDTPAAGTTLYRAEVYFENHTLFANVTSERPSFNVSRLDADTSYQIKVYVTHGPVTSLPVVVSAYTSRVTRRSRAEVRPTRGSSVGGLVGGVILAAIVMGGAVWARHFCSKRWRDRSERAKHDVARPSSDDSNPDVVPNIAEETYDLLLAEAKSRETLYQDLDSSPQRSSPMQQQQHQQEQQQSEAPHQLPQPQQQQHTQQQVLPPHQQQQQMSQQQQQQQQQHSSSSSSNK
ncbi:hemicentin-1-like isoform X2 [Portunus trituberculatus]|uniref:hemicentin-1-like isoform X2 n=1 Tax=Portunus trituberculatus TaxID=210409 RepID=UPI001E1CE932|nr:hemicentin-1-like isoform X2 [Portunus trituberculatus]